MRGKELVEHDFQIFVQRCFLGCEHDVAFGMESDVFLFLVGGVNRGDDGIHVDQVDDFLQIGQGVVVHLARPPPRIPDDDEAAVFLRGNVEVLALIIEADVLLFVQRRLAADGLKHGHDQVLRGDIVQVFLREPFQQRLMLPPEIKEAHNGPHRQCDYRYENSQVFHNCSLWVSSFLCKGKCS